MYDISIIGAGPVGSYLANKLCKVGLSVLVVEKKKNAAANTHCTGIISSECFNLLGPVNGIKHREINALNVIGPSGKSIHFQKDKTFALVVDRPSLNSKLVSIAEGSGAKYLFSTTVTDINVQTNKASLLTCNTSGEYKTIETHVVIIATGYGSRLTNKLGLGKINHFTCAAQANIEMGRDNLEIYADHKLAPGGFAWLVPTWDGSGLAGLLCKNHPGSYIKKFLNTLKNQHKIEQTEYPYWSGLIPVRALKKTFSDRLLVVGEAAGQIKPLTGGGIYYGVLAADIAANTIQKTFSTGDFSDKFLSIYQKRWQEVLQKEISFGYRLRNIWASMGNNTITRLFNTGSNLKLPELVSTSDKLQFDWHRKTLLALLMSFLSFTNHK